MSTLAQHIDSNAYAGDVTVSPYDLLAAHNREYQRLLVEVGDVFRRSAKAGDRIADLGCGTGNFTRAVAEAVTSARPCHIEGFDLAPAMIEIAKSKAGAWSSMHRIDYLLGDVTKPDLIEEVSLDGVVTVHALNLTQTPQTVISNIGRWLKSGGYFCAIDIGRPLIVRNWARRVVRWVYSDFRRAGHGRASSALRTAAFFARVQPAARQNRLFQTAQQQGVYPMHATDEFRSWFESAGLKVLECRMVYHDPTSGTPISDFIVGTKP